MKICPECRDEFEDTLSECPEDHASITSQNLNPIIGICLANRYQIVSVIGTGGSGVVYRAHHMKMDRPVAIKMMHSHMVARPDALKRFYEEAKTIAQLKHHNIVTLLDFGIGPDNQPFLVMDYVEGSSLKKSTKENGPISLEQMRSILVQIVDGLSYAHADGIIHQDLKPENIMLTPAANGSEKVTLVDFGMAALHTQDKDMAISGIKKKKFSGSPYYMSPEQCLSSPIIDGRSDIYSLAFVLYEALSGKLPFEAKSGMVMMDSHVREIPTPFFHSNPDLLGLQVCSEVTRVFNKAMEKEREKRYQTVEEFGTDLNEALARDHVKWKAIKHRSLAAEQVLVQARQTAHNQNGIILDNEHNTTDATDLESQLQSGRQFLTRQAKIEATYFNIPVGINLDPPVTICPKDNINNKNNVVNKDNLVIKFLRKMRIICEPIEETVIIPAEANKEISQCPYCQAKVTEGIQFCLICQRRLSVSALTNKLSENRNGNSFTHHRIKNLDAEANGIEARSNIRSLRQQKATKNLNKIQTLLNYSLVIGVILCSIIVAINYFDWNKSSRTNNNFVNVPAQAVKPEQPEASKAADETENSSLEQNKTP